MKQKNVFLNGVIYSLAILLFLRIVVWVRNYRAVIYHALDINEQILSSLSFWLLPLIEVISPGIIILTFYSLALSRKARFQLILSFGGSSKGQRMVKECLWVLLFTLIPLLTGAMMFFLLHRLLSPEGAALAAVGAFFMVSLLFIFGFDEEARIIPHRGTSLITQEKAIEKAETLNHDDHFKFFWGALYLPNAIAPKHQIAIGSTGSGKSTLIWGLMQSTLPHVGEGYGHLAFILDDKREMLSYLAGAGLIDRTILLSPLDKRGVAWAIGRDVRHPAVARTVAEGLIVPDPQSKQRYFRDTAVEIVRACIIGLHLTQGANWGLADLVYVTSSPENIIRHLKRVPEMKHIVEQHAQKIGETFQSVVSTAAGSLSRLSTVVAAEQRAKTRISLTEYIRGKKEGIFVLHGNDLMVDEIVPYNRLILSFAGKLALSLPTSRTRRIRFFLDEVQTLREFDLLSDLLSRGRGRGICVTCGIQDIAQFDEHYGETKRKIMMTNFHQRLFLKNNDAESQKLFSEMIGSHELIETSYNESSSSTGGNTFGTSRGIQNRPLVLSSEFSDLPEADWEKGIYGYAHIDGIGKYPMFLSPERIAEFPQVDEEYENNIEVEVEDEMRDWLVKPLSEEEEKRLFGDVDVHKNKVELQIDKNKIKNQNEKPPTLIVNGNVKPPRKVMI